VSPEGVVVCVQFFKRLQQKGKWWKDPKFMSGEKRLFFLNQKTSRLAYVQCKADKIKNLTIAIRFDC